jgi:acetylornithine deacetylase
MLSEQTKKVLTLVDDSEAGIVEFLQQLISFPTVTPPEGGRAEGDAFRGFQSLIGQTLAEMGFSLDVWEADAAQLEDFPGAGLDKQRDLSDMPIVVGRRAGTGGGRSLILNGHYDVVSPGKRENWRHDPFAGTVEEGKIFGRGTCDMKGGITAMLWAVKLIRQAGIDLAGDLTVQIVPDEESTCMGTLACCQRGYRADAAIIPEPTDMKVLVAMRGSLYGVIRVFGRAGHAELAQPHWRQGGAVNAITKSVKVIEAMEALTTSWRRRPDNQHPYLDPGKIIPTVIKGGDWTVTYPEEVEITFGAIFPPGMTGVQQEIEEMLAQVAAGDPWLEEHPPRLEVGGWHYGAEIDPAEPIVRSALDALNALGLEPELKGFGSLTDAIHLINYAHIPTISLGPKLGPAHTADEYIEIKELLAMTKALALTIMDWCGPAAGGPSG